MDLGIRGRTALVLGATGGLGRAMVMALAREGALVAAGGRSAEGLEGVSEDAKRAGVDLLPVRLDLADRDTLDAAVRQTTDTLGPVSILVNNTGGPPPTPAAGVPAQEWDRHFASMVSSIIHLTDLVLPAMRAAGWGRIITSTSSGVVAPIANLALSNALRSTLVGWSKTLAAEVGGDGVTANIVVPGRIATDRVARLDAARAAREDLPLAQVMADSAKTIPAGRYGRPEEYADTVAFLASERASFINGAMIRVDGGMIPTV